MAFTRKFLLDNGVPEENVDAIMAERNRTLGDYIPKGDVQEQINAAVEDYKAKNPVPQPIKVEDSDEYKTVVAERDMVRALSGDDFADVKPKFRETVYKMLDRAEGAKPIAEQLSGIAEKYEEYFTTTPGSEEPAKPTFGAPTQGEMPKGYKPGGFSEAWGYKQKGV